MVRADCLFLCDIVVAMLVVIKRGFLFSFFRVFTTIEKGLQAVFISVPQNLMQSTYSTLSLSRPTISGSKRCTPARIVDITLTVLSFTGLRNVIKFDISHQFPFVNAFVSSCCDRYRLMYFKILFFRDVFAGPQKNVTVFHICWLILTLIRTHTVSGLFCSFSPRFHLRNRWLNLIQVLVIVR